MLRDFDGDPSGQPAKEGDSNSLEQVCHSAEHTDRLQAD